LKISVIVSTYNRTDALNAVLAGLAAQKGMPEHDWEVIVADDGSGPATKVLVDEWRTRFRCQLHHVWHEDTGFRLASIRNRSAAEAQGDWLVFMDGDCIPFPDFVLEHVRLAEQGWFVAGNRVLLSEAFTRRLLASPDPSAPTRWSPVGWLLARLCGHANRALPWLRLQLSQARKKRALRWQVLKGCNIGVSKRDYLTVNGFDEAFSGWGREDSDFAIRLIRAGILLKDGRFAVPVLHLWHRENDRSGLPENERRLAAILSAKRVRAEVGVDRYLEEPRCGS